MLPPGPPGDPFIGHLLRMPSNDSALVFHQWAKTYGPVMHLQVLGRDMIILDSYQAALDLLDKRGLIYSDRPKFTLYQLLGWDPSFVFVSYGTKTQIVQWQMHQSYLSRHNIGDFKLMQTEQSRRLVQNLMESPPEQYAKLMSSIIAQIVAGHRVTSDNDPYLRISEMVYECMSKTGPPGSSPLDFFPVLQHFPSWFPGAGHLRIVRTGRPAIRGLHEFPLRTVKEQQKLGEATPSFIREQLERIKEGEDEEQLKGAAATMFAAGELTTWTTLTLFVLAMALHPESQAKAQQEIDLVVGDTCLPEFRDREDLPFVESILQETLRFYVADALKGVPHCTREDDMYCGMLILKGSLVFANIRAMGLDESVYSDPTSFRPEHYLPEPAGAGEPHFSNVAFGFGRRFSCATPVSSLFS
ncbi:cytochrome P450 [Mycena sanguinolenta]|nr:cytochrome P450 [Mycena sanguinolenta]